MKNMLNNILNKAFVFTLAILITTNNVKAFDDFSDAVNVKIGVDKSSNTSTVHKNNSVSTKNSNLQVIKHNSKIERNDHFSQIPPRRNLEREEAINEVNSVINNEKQAKQIVNIIGINNYSNFVDSIGGAKSIPTFIMTQFNDSLLDFKTFVEGVGRDNVASVISTIKPSNIGDFITSIGGVENISTFANQINGIGNLPSLMSSVKNVANLNTLINQVGLNDLGSFINGLGSFSAITQIAESLGGFNEIGSFLSSINGVSNLSSLVSGLGSVENLISLTNVTGGFSNLQNLIQGAGGISNLTSLANGIGINELGSVLSQLGGGNLIAGASQLSSFIGGFSDFGGVDGFVSLFNYLNGFGGLSALQNLQSLSDIIGGFGNFGNLLNSVGSISNLTSLLGGLGSMSNFSSFFTGIGNFSGLSNFSGLVTGLFGGYGSNLLQNFLGSGNLNFNNILGSFGSLPGVSNLVSGMGFNNLANFMQWAQQYLSFFGIAFGNIANNCENQGGVLRCAARNILQGVLSLFGGCGCGYTDMGDGSYNYGSSIVNAEQLSGTYNGMSGLLENQTPMDYITQRQNGVKPKSLKMDTSKIDYSIFPKKIVYAPDLKKKNLGNNSKFNSNIIKSSDIRPQLDINNIADNSGDEQKETFKKIKEEIEKYTDTSEISSREGKSKLPFVLGNKDAEQFRNDEEQIAVDGDFKMCNKKLDQEKLDINKLTSGETSYYEIPLCGDGEGEYIISANSNHGGGYFEHHAYNKLMGNRADFNNDPGEPLTGCYEIHKVKEGAPLRVVGRCRMTFGIEGVPAKFRRWIPVLFGCLEGCTTWTIISDKVEYYYPTYLATLSQDPLYSRYLDEDTTQKMFSKYKSAVETEIKQQEMSNKTSKRVLESITDNKKDKKTNVNNERAIQPSKGVPETRFLSQSKHGYMRIFPIRPAEDAYKNSTWRGAFRVIPHITSNKDYWGTDFEGQNGGTFFAENKDKENLHFYLTGYGDNVKKKLVDKDEEHLKAPWNTVRRDGTVGGSKQYDNKRMKADPELHGKGVLPDDEFKLHNTAVENKNAFGVGNISALNNITLNRSNSDYILQTLIRSHNMFIAEKKPIEKLTFADEDRVKPILEDNTEGMCQGGPLEDGQMIPSMAIGNHAIVRSIIGTTFYNTITTPIQGDRQTFKIRYDLLHAPVKTKQDGTVEYDNNPKLFNEFFNIDVQNIVDMPIGNQAKKENVKMHKGDTCYTLFDMTNNNLDFNLTNTITKKFNNIETVANKGEISFIIYNLFSGTIAFPGMSCNTWYHGVGVTPKPTGGSCYDMNGGSKAKPRIRNDEFRLF